MVVSILGCGWYGKALASALIEQGITVKGSATSPEKLDLLADQGILAYLINLVPGESTFDPDFFECDVLVISIPPKFKGGQATAYLLKIRRIIDSLIAHHIDKVIYISSTGVYGDINDEVNELTTPLPDSEGGFILLEAEKLLNTQPQFKTTILRFGGLVGPGRRPGRFFAGKQNIPNGQAPVNLIHLNDCIDISVSIIKKEMYGYLFNACSPHHPPKAQFYQHAAAEAGLPAPIFIDELKNWKVINSINLQTTLNYHFKIANWLSFQFGNL